MITVILPKVPLLIPSLKVFKILRWIWLILEVKSDIFIFLKLLEKLFCFREGVRIFLSFVQIQNNNLNWMFQAGTRQQLSGQKSLLFLFLERTSDNLFHLFVDLWCIFWLDQIKCNNKFLRHRTNKQKLLLKVIK